MFWDSVLPFLLVSLFNLHLILIDNFCCLILFKKGQTVKSFKINSRVEAKFKGKGKRYYPGTIVGVNRVQNCYGVDYDDDNEDQDLSHRFTQKLRDNNSGAFNKNVVCAHIKIEAKIEVNLHNTRCVGL